eukprot:930867-Pyramimonas_sp.AAC.1
MPVRGTIGRYLVSWKGYVGSDAVSGRGRGKCACQSSAAPASNSLFTVTAQLRAPSSLRTRVGM